MLQQALVDILQTNNFQAIYANPNDTEYNNDRPDLIDFTTVSPDARSYDYFQRYFYPGVSSLYQNKLHQNMPAFVEQKMRDSSDAAKLKHRVMWIKAMAICYELVETGLLFQQQYNTGYYKGIADDSYAAMVK